MNVDVKYRDENVKRLSFDDKGDCIDLAINNRIEAKAGDMVFVDLGFAAKFYDGYGAKIYPRSSTFKKTGLILSNSIGVIDNNYSGNDDYWGAMFYATRDVKVEKGVRLLQFEIVETMHKKFGKISFNETDQLDDVNRGGFGSTGD